MILPSFAKYWDRVNKNSNQKTKRLWSTYRAHQHDGSKWFNATFSKKECACQRHHQIPRLIEKLETNQYQCSAIVVVPTILCELHHTFILTSKVILVLFFLLVFFFFLRICRVMILFLVRNIRIVKSLFHLSFLLYYNSYN